MLKLFLRKLAFIQLAIVFKTKAVIILQMHLSEIWSL